MPKIIQALRNLFGRNEFHIEITPEQLLTGKGIDDDYNKPIDIKVSFQDKELLVEYHELGNEQQKRVQAYLKALKKLEKLEDLQ